MPLWTVFTVVSTDIVASDEASAVSQHADRLRRDGQEPCGDGVAVLATEQIVITDLEIIDVIPTEEAS